MVTYQQPVSIRALGIASLVFGILGGAFYWWTPLGIVSSILGLVLGFVGWTSARRHGVGFALSIFGMLVSLATLILGSVIAAYGMEIIRLHAFR